MHITAVCPFCQTSYQVQPELRGQPLRCPSPGCRKIFTVAGDLPASEDSSSPSRAPKPSAPPENGQRSGTVGEMVPILPAEPIVPEGESANPSPQVAEAVPLAPIEPAGPDPRPADGSWWQTPPPVRQPSGRTQPPPSAAPTQPAEATWWGDAPPPVRHPQARTEPSAPKQRRRSRGTPHSAPLTQSMPALPDLPDQRREPPSGEREAPPAHRGSHAAEPEEQHSTATEEMPPDDDHAPRVSKRHAWRLITVLILLPLLIVGGGTALVYQIVQNSEENRFKEAKEEYEHLKYGNAAGHFHELADKFRNSEHAEEYRFLGEWSDLCSDLTNTESDVTAGLDKLDTFIKEHKDNPLMGQKENASVAGKMLLNLVKTFGERNGSPTSPEPLAVARRIEQVRRTVEGIGPDALTKANEATIDQTLATVRGAVDRWQERQQALLQLNRQDKETPSDAIKRVRLFLEKENPKLPGFRNDPEARALMEQLYAAHLNSIVYEPRGEQVPEAKAVHLEDNLPTLLFDPLLTPDSPGSASPQDPIKLALVRGVLYALRQSNGEIKWAMRVGIDTTVLPQRVPPSQASRERILVLSADTQTLTALDDNGNLVWEYYVGQPVLGRPVIVKQRAYLAAYDGWVHEIELSEGNRVGRYKLGQPLSRGGAHEAGTDRIYFPADDSCIYVLDVAQHRCTTILYDGHPSGSLRSEPVIIPPEAEGSPGYLILNQTSGLDAMRLRVFELPLQDRHAAPVDLDPPAQIAGWTWFEPYQDGEKMVMLSDAGILGLFGIRQAGNRDQALFPLLQPGGLDLSRFLHGEGQRPRERGRSQVVHMRDNDLWVLAHGRLQQVQLLWKNPVGPQASAGWKAPLELGSPLHAPQRIEDRTGRSTFFLVTQPLHRQTCVASAVDDAGRILWQRQLGLVCQGEPLVLTPPQGGPPLLLALDQSGALFTLDPMRPASKSWRNIASALDDNPRRPPFLLRAPDGHSVYEIVVPGEGKSLIVRYITWTSERALRVQERSVSLASATGGASQVLAGTPAIIGSHLIVPLADGILGRVPLPVPQDAHFESGPDWRSPKASPGASGHVLALGGDRFLVTDGGRGLAVWEWPAEKTWQPLPEGRDPFPEMLHFVAAPPVVLPTKAGLAPQVILADSAGTLHLLAVTPDGALQPNRKWELQGRFTDGPFVRVLPDGGVRVGCILDQRRLAWIDPASEKTQPLWTYRADGETILGQPQLVEDLLVVAHQSGHYLALDPTTGKAKGPGYTLRASVAPAATPVPFGSDRLFTPLSDGTALLLPRKRLREAPEK